jgi:hypothetical protein
MKEAFNTLLRNGSLLGAVVFAVALMIGPGMALADWEFTRWGLTVNEVERASRYSAIKNGQGYGCMLEIHDPTTFLGIRFSLVKFCFNDETLLESVDLLASVNAYGAIERTLRRAYGPPQIPREVDQLSSSWTDKERGDRIDLSLADKTIVTYSQAPKGPLKRTSASGP